MRLLFALLLLTGCPARKAETGATDARPAAVAIACPPGTREIGATPPTGYEVYCAIVGTDGVPKRQGPAITWHDNGTRASLGQYESGRKHGFWQYWYPNGQLEKQGSFAQDAATGTWTEFRTDGGRSAEGEMLGGRPHGRWVYWHPNGQIQAEGSFADGERDGVWREYDDHGAPIVEREYRGGRLIAHREL